MKNIFILILGISFQNSFAADCIPSSYSELVKCAETKSSDVNISEQNLRASKELEGAANQWLNPELEVDSVAKGSNNSEVTASLLFTFRLGGKKSALLNEARSEIQKAEATHDLSASQTRLAIMLSVYKLSHLKSEVALLEEAVETFTKIINQFQKRPALSPEQNVSLSVFKMVQADHQLKLAKVKVDQEKLLQLFTSLTGIAKADIIKNLPSRKQQWPEIQSSDSIESSPQLRQARAELMLAKSKKEKVDSEAWPDIKVGPSMRTTQDQGVNTTYVGFSLSMPIPIFTQNGGAKAYQAQKIVEAELVLNQSTRKLEATKRELINRYGQIVQELKNIPNIKAINEKHVEIERQFFKGVVPSSLIIEAHRQLFELEEQANSSELEALETYGHILILDNKFNGVIL